MGTTGVAISWLAAGRLERIQVPFPGTTAVAPTRIT